MLSTSTMARIAGSTAAITTPSGVPPVKLTKMDLILSVILNAGAVLALLIIFVSLWRSGQMATFIRDKNMLPALTVIVIVLAASTLAFVGRLSSEICTLFAGIAGYVLGGTRRRSATAAPPGAPPSPPLPPPSGGGGGPSRPQGQRQANVPAAGGEGEAANPSDANPVR